MVFLIYFLLFRHIVCGNFHKVNFSLINDDMMIDIKMNDNDTMKTISINLFGSFSIIRDEMYNKTNSKTYVSIKNDRISFNGNDYVKYELISDDLIMNDLLINNFTFFYFNEYISSKSSLAFGSSFFYKNLSIVTNLYENKLIDKNEFGIIFDDSNKGHLYLGGFTQDIISNFDSVTMKISPNYITWGCLVDGYYFNEDGHNNSYYSFINANSKEIIAPKDVYEDIKLEYMENYINEGKCKVEKKNYKEYVYCDFTIVNEFRDIGFIISNRSYSIDKEDLFQCYYDNCRLLIHSNFDIGNIWVFGNSFLKKYPVSFSYVNRTITIYSKKEEVMHRKEIRIYFIITVIILMIMFIIVNIIIKYKN